MEKLDYLFKPRNIAVIGATPKKDWLWSSGNNWINGALKQGFQGPIYPVHPTAEKILGFKAYPSVLNIPDDLDLAIFTVPISAVIHVLKECVEKGVRYVHLLTAGFSETGNAADADIEKQVVDIARENNIRLIGPNCMGVYCPEGGVAWTDEFPTTAGPVGFFSQSGQIAHMVIDSARRLKLGFSKVVSFGNASDLQPNEFLTYLSNDPSTDLIGAYLEGLKNGQAFFEAARETTKKKPVVIWKGGQTRGGARATLSHTSAIAGSDKIWKAFCRQAGIIPADTTEEMVYTLQALKMMPLPAKTNVAILGGAGGGSVTMTDLAEKEGLTVPQLTDDTIAQLGEFIRPEGSSTKNPLDIMHYLTSEQNLLRVMTLLREDPNIDVLIFDIHPDWIVEDYGEEALAVYLDMVLASEKILKKPMFVVLAREEDMARALVIKKVVDRFRDAGMATFPGFQLVARIIKRLNTYSDYLCSSHP